MEAVRGHLAPEFINRIDSTILFNRLSRGNMRNIVDVQLKGDDVIIVDIYAYILTRYTEVSKSLNEKNIFLNLSDGAKKWLAEKGYDPAYGARPLKRLVQSEILHPLSTMILQVRNCFDSTAL